MYEFSTNRKFFQCRGKRKLSMNSISACVISSEFTREVVMKFISPVSLNLIFYPFKDFSVSVQSGKYREVNVKN